ncbi:MAG: response regulator [Actinomycetota bacterium]
MSQTERSVLIISSHVALYERLVTEAGFTVVAAADLPPAGERLAELSDPAYIVLDVDLPGEQGFEVVDRLRSIVPRARILLVVNQEWQAAHSRAHGLAAVLGRSDLLELGRRLNVLAAKAAHQRDYDRRSGDERRLEQVWAKVGWQKRFDIRRAEDRIAV